LGETTYYPYIRIMADIIESGLWAKLSVGARTLYPVLLKFSDSSFKPVWPATETLLRLTGFRTKKSIVLAKRDLVQAGLLFQVPGGGRTATKYYFSFHYPGSKITPLGRKGMPPWEGEKSTSEREPVPTLGVPQVSPNHINITISNQNQIPETSPSSKEEGKGEKESFLSDLVQLYGSEIAFSVYREAEELHLERDKAYLQAACKKAMLLKSKQVSSAPPQGSHPLSWKGFLDWASGKLSPSTWKELEQAQVGLDGLVLVVQTPLSVYARGIVEQYFRARNLSSDHLLFLEPAEVSRLSEIH